MLSRRQKRKLVHHAVFLGLCAASAIDYYLEMRGIAVGMSVAVNGLWVFYG